MKISKYGLFRVAVATPETRVADVEFNTEKIVRLVEKSSEKGAVLLVTPELSLSSYTCGDLFFEKKLRSEVLRSLELIAAKTKETSTAVIVGAPISSNGRLYNCAVMINNGNVEGIVPKTYLCNTNEYYEERWFSSEKDRVEDFISLGSNEIPFGADILFEISELNVKIGIEICEDLWAVIPPSLGMASAGANIICNLSASDEKLEKMQLRKDVVKMQSARCFGAYLYSACGPGESTGDLVYSGHSMIAENGNIISETERFSFKDQLIVKDIDIDYLEDSRLRNNSYGFSALPFDYRIIPIAFDEKNTDEIYLNIDSTPFIPKEDSNAYFREVIDIQTTGLAKRIMHIGCKNVVIGISGGLDSTLALLICASAFEKLNLDKKGIHAITMPGFGTTGRTRGNAEKLADLLEISLKEIPISDSVLQHFKDIGHNPETKDIVYENAQARERTQILMDYANIVSGIVVGTGDLSELALGWATYNGDQMSMYGVNAGIPKTLLKEVVRFKASSESNKDISQVLLDIIDTPISPELLPADEGGNIKQKTEDKLGPYEVHDFILFHLLRRHFSPGKIFLLAVRAFAGQYGGEQLKSWFKLFYSRFFSQQFKRSAMPDGAKIGFYGLSPRGDWRMPSDATAVIWLKEIDEL